MADEKSFLKGAMVLVVANFIVKFIGVIYKIPLGNLISGDGMAYFTAAFDIYLMLIAVSTNGVPVAVSKLVSESYALKRYEETDKIFKVAMKNFLIFGFIGFLIMFFGAGLFADFIDIPDAKLSIQALSPAVFFFSIVSIYRGYFQGMQNMNPTALTQILEALAKVFVGIGLTMILYNKGFEAKVLSASAILGTTFSTVVASILLVIIYNSKANRIKIEKNRDLGGYCRSSKRILKDLIKVVVPITIGSMVVYLTGFLDLFLIMNRLGDAGFTDQMAEFAYGSYKGYAYTIYNLPPSIIVSINVTLIPLITATFTVDDMSQARYVINKSLKIISIITFPCAVGMIAIPKQILTMLYPSKVEEVLIATPLLACLGFAIICTSLSSFSTIVLQSMGRINLPITSILFGSIVKLIANYILVGNPNIGILGAPIATNLCYFSILAINMWHIRRSSKVKIDFWSNFLTPAPSALIMGVVTIGSNKALNLITFLNPSFATFLTILISALTYLILIIKTKTLTEEDISLVKNVKKIEK